MKHEVNCGYPEDGGKECQTCREFFDKTKLSGRCACGHPIDTHRLDKTGRVEACPAGKP